MKTNILEEVIGLEDTEVLYNAIVIRGKLNIPYKNVNWETLKKILKYHKEEQGREVIYNEVE